MTNLSTEPPRETRFPHGNRHDAARSEAAGISSEYFQPGTALLKTVEQVRIAQGTSSGSGGKNDEIPLFLSGLISQR